MKGMFAVLLFTALTALCWGVYGPVLQVGQAGMGGSRLLPFVCVGLAYFVIAVAVPVTFLTTRGEPEHWSATGSIWSLAAGAAGALGALGIILAFSFHGNPIYVMPLVFGGAPVVNTFYTMYMARTYKAAGPIFFAGLILVVAGAVAVLIFRPAAHAGPAGHEFTNRDLLIVGLSVAMTALCWGVYGPVLHKGQLAMAGSRLRPLICVGLAYFLIAVLLPAAALAQAGVPDWTVSGALWSLAGGAVGAIGALGIILAFNAGGKPIYVMPLVFGAAPVINTFATIVRQGISGTVHPVFYAGLIMVVVGAVTVLIFAPKGAPHAKPAHAEPATAVS